MFHSLLRMEKLIVLQLRQLLDILLLETRLHRSSPQVKSNFTSQFPRCLFLTLHVANYGSDTVSVIQQSSNDVISTINVGHEPVSVMYDGVEQSVFVANFGSGTVSSISALLVVPPPQTTTSSSTVGSGSTQASSTTSTSSQTSSGTSSTRGRAASLFQKESLNLFIMRISPHKWTSKAPKG